MMDLRRTTGRIKIKGTLGRFLREEDYKVDFAVEVDQTDLSKSMSKIQKN